MTAVNPSETATIIAALEQIHPAQTFLLSTFASEVRVSDTKKISMDLRQGTRRVAPLVHPRNPAKVGERGLLSSDDITPAYLKPARKITGEDLDKRLAGEIGNAPMPRPERLRRLRTMDAAEMRDENTRFEEFTLAQQLTTGAVNIAGDGMDLVVTLPLLADHIVAPGGLAGGPWTGAGAKPLHDIKRSRQKIGRDATIKGNIAIFGSQAWEDFLDNDQVQKLVDNRRIDPNGDIQLGTGEINVNRHGGTGGISYFTYDEHYQDENDVLQPMIPETVVIVASTMMRVVRAYGRISSVRQTQATPEWVHEWIEENPETNYVSIESAPLPYVQQVNGFVILTTQ